ncbi:hypothetical protein BSKO_11463 [Bryopsis sp. KO-2023]|nr:hypothetical protein BSKO_11463 [Bryopsis sp. KO-2023]
MLFCSRHRPALITSAAASSTATVTMEGKRNMEFRPSPVEPMTRADSKWESLTPAPRSPLKDWVKAGAWALGWGDVLSCFKTPPRRDIDLDRTSSSGSAGIPAFGTVGFSLWGDRAFSFSPQSKEASGEDVEASPKVAYQGCPGAFSESAALELFPQSEPVPYETTDKAFEAVVSDEVSKALVPIENSIGGPATGVYGCLAKHPELKIVEEVVFDIDHCLVALPGTKISDIKRVYSDPQALAQCGDYLSTLGVEVVPHSDTAGAAATIRSKKRLDFAAIASRRAAHMYTLSVLDESIQNHTDNVTRFVAISKTEGKAPEPHMVAPHECKTSVVVGLKQGQNLTSVLSAFASMEIEVDHIQSAPLRVGNMAERENATGRFNRVYFIDLIGSLAEPLCKLAVERAKESAGFFRSLGSYQRDSRF